MANVRIEHTGFTEHKGMCWKIGEGKHQNPVPYEPTVAGVFLSMPQRMLWRRLENAKHCNMKSSSHQEIFLGFIKKL